ncbi:MAG: OmpA family protein [Lentisphaerae bacterium]|nr:OmpA family protein [Lentisphaerota bacterium]
MRSDRLTVVAIGVACGIVLGAGCKTKQPRGVTQQDLLVPEVLEGDIALGERFEDGVRVTDIRVDNVLFAYDSFQIANAEVGKIEQAADYMRRNRGVRLVTEGHCDERGSREYNMALGEHRALAVRAYLVGLGIDGSRIQTRSYGEETPLDAGHGESAWRVNRRVEFALYK